MFRNVTLERFSSASSIINSLKEDADFHKYCIQEKLNQGPLNHFSVVNNIFYLIESGFVIGSRNMGFGEQLPILLQSGDFPYLPSYIEETPQSMECEALTEVTWWRIDTSFFQKIIANDLLTTRLAKSERNIQEHALMDRMHPEQRIYFSLHIMMQLGSEVKANVLKLPVFVDVEKLAAYAVTSIDYTGDILQALQEKNIISTEKTPWVIEDITAFHTLLESENIFAQP
ncbi:Crp/Fnr family transcriptional regulator [Listeria grandensis]|uniref:Crp/Fnr family transcriptional regulator n=1 Tax=Listeria grandensis TaxID=1494963 RepID=A0A7X0Y648_9LIST|nr:Crp/Fnr family transcriptional regulator [Listeria grandensis]MBC1937696.1 Crp/Fnr family transcriptional regulator [Listeria grandensis]